LTGYITGIFQNTDATDLSSNGWYAVNLTIDLNSFAAANGYLNAVGGDNPVPADISVFGSNVTTPEPATFVLFGTGFAGLLAFRRRKTRA
jgi:hypothetical protein